MTLGARCVWTGSHVPGSMITSNTRTCSFSKSSRCDCGAAMHASNLSGHGHSPSGGGVSVTDLCSGAVTALWATIVAFANSTTEMVLPIDHVANSPVRARPAISPSEIGVLDTTCRVDRTMCVRSADRAVDRVRLGNRARAGSLPKPSQSWGSGGLESQTLTGSARRRPARGHW
jgi:hypothetical protein